ncbi:hypothetical protein [Dactylosporangium aurantiacum]|nr:hypothetical protein [Dactylosporangium aurantiacum]MDG6110200.1 hypothetical protein [Dactylosporangium aurantiacum]
MPSPRARKAGALIMWFAVLGGALAWTAHLFVAWGTDELTCRSGHTSIGPVPVQAVVAAGVVLPALVTVAAMWTAWRAWRRLSGRGRGDDPRTERAGLLALLGLCADGLFLIIILAGGAALLVFPPCQS